MLTVQEAVKKATQVLSELMPPADDLRLEEIELSDEGPWWDITLSFPDPSVDQFAEILGRRDRSYKLVRLNRDTGEFHAVRIRKV